jgi:hypothetical protein
MNNKFLVVVIAILLLLTGMDCFAQGVDVRVRALQGEWICIKLQHGNEVIDLTQLPYVEMVENVWKFEENNFFSVSRNFQDGTSQVDTATFTIVGESLVMSSGGRSDAYSYTLVDNILTATGDGYIFTLRKR